MTPGFVNPHQHAILSLVRGVAADLGWPVVVFRKRTKAVIRRTSQAVGAVGLAVGGFATGVRWARSR